MTKNLKVSTEANTRLVEILYDSTDPQLAADFVNALTAEFIQQNLESRWKTTQQTGEWLTRQMEDVRIKLEKSEDQLQTYAQLRACCSPRKRITSPKTSCGSFRRSSPRRRPTVSPSNRNTSWRLQHLRIPFPEVLDDATLKDYQVKLTDLRRQLAELSSTLTPAHPSVKKVQAQVDALEAALEKRARRRHAAHPERIRVRPTPRTVAGHELRCPGPPGDGAGRQSHPLQHSQERGG